MRTLLQVVNSLSIVRSINRDVCVIQRMHSTKDATIITKLANNYYYCIIRDYSIMHATYRMSN